MWPISRGDVHHLSSQTNGVIILTWSVQGNCTWSAGLLMLLYFTLSRGFWWPRTHLAGPSSSVVPGLQPSGPLYTGLIYPLPVLTLSCACKIYSFAPVSVPVCVSCRHSELDNQGHLWWFFIFLVCILPGRVPHTEVTFNNYLLNKYKDSLPLILSVGDKPIIPGATCLAFAWWSLGPLVTGHPRPPFSRCVDKGSGPRFALWTVSCVEVHGCLHFTFVPPFDHLLFSSFNLPSCHVCTLEVALNLFLSNKGIASFEVIWSHLKLLQFSPIRLGNRHLLGTQNWVPCCRKYERILY